MAPFSVEQELSEPRSSGYVATLAVHAPVTVSNVSTCVMMLSYPLMGSGIVRPPNSHSLVPTAHASWRYRGIGMGGAVEYVSDAVS